MIEVRNLRKTYSRGKEIIKGLTINFGETGLNIIAGKSGCGKTTLINILGGMDLSYEGEVVVDGLELHNSKYIDIADYRNFTSAFVFQKNSLFEFLTVKENLELCLNIQNNKSDIGEALERVGLKGFENKKVKALSGGEKQRVAIARALIKDCKIIFADEPTSALDSKNAHKIFQLFKELSKDRLVIMVTHDVKKASMYADRLVKLIDGTIEEDIVYNEVNTAARVLAPKKSKSFSMMPIFKHNLKTGMVINLFVILLLVVGLVITNIALEQKKVKEEYDNYGITDTTFNIDRAIETQVRNNVDMYKIVKKQDADDPYYYIKNAVDYNADLSEGDYSLITSNINGYDLYEGSNDADYENLIIPGISKRDRLDYTSLGMNYYWYTYSQSNYTSFTYNEDYSYDLLMGRLPEKDNEILVTDIVADHYLRNRAYSPGTYYQPFYTDYVVNYNDLLNDTYQVYYSNYGASYFESDTDTLIDVENDFVIYDTYGTINGTFNGSKTYYRYNENHYKVVGIINTGIVDYYTYNYNLGRYYLLNQFETQSGTESYMNSLNYQPGGYVVIPNGLSGTNETVDYETPFAVDKITTNNKVLSNYISAFTGKYDYTGYNNAIYGYSDDLQEDHVNRLLALNTTDTKIKDDEIIISVSMAQKLFPSVYFTVNNANSKFSRIANEKVTLELVCNNKTITKEFTIIGICRNFDGDFYVSDNVFKELYISNKGTSPSLSVNLENCSTSKRKKLMNELYELGYCLVPEDNMPGAYLELVENKGEMIAKVDLEGLISLYPDYTMYTEGVNKYFYVGDMNYGQIVGEYVYMSSSIVRQITLDDSYYTSQGNISPYYLFSDYYNSSNVECVTSSDKGNSLLEIINGLYQFFIIVAIVLSIGFICLKEFRQGASVTKLSMLGVRNKDLINLNLLTYIPMMLVVLILALFGTKIFVNIINKMYSFSFVDTNITINRIRLLFTSESTILICVSSIVLLGVILLTTSFITLKNRK